jgi:hypothetical protein
MPELKPLAFSTFDDVIVRLEAVDWSLREKFVKSSSDRRRSGN